MSEPTPDPTPEPVPEFTPDMIYASLFDPVLSREVEDYAKQMGWDKLPAIDLLQVPKEKWDEVLNRTLQWPPDVQQYIDARGLAENLTTDERNAIELRMEEFYGVTCPYYITHSGKEPYLAKE